MNYILFSSLFLLSSLCLGQSARTEIDKRMKDPNIVWLAETYLDLEDLHNSYEGDNRQKPTGPLFSSLQRSYTIKRKSDSPLIDWETWLNEQMISQPKSIYEDADLAKTLFLSDVEEQNLDLDTVIVFNPNTFEESIQVVRNSFNPSNIKGYRLRVLVYYNLKQKRLQSQALAIAPLHRPRDQKDLQPLFWMDIINREEPMDPFKSSELSLIRSIEYSSDLKQYKELKKVISRDSMLRHFGAQLLAEQKKVFANSSNDLEAKPLTSQELDQALILRDTVQFLADDLITKDSILTKKTMTDEGISHLRLTYWIGINKIGSDFVIAPYSIAPAYAKKDEQDKLLYIMPLFYLYPSRWYK